MIPALMAIPGAPWDVPPPGQHPATLAEVELLFAYNHRRRALFDGLVRAARALRHAGCGRLFLDGSYVTAKPIPGDYDACWASEGVVEARLDPVFRDFRNFRQAHKDKYGGEFFPADMPNRLGETILDLFQKEKATGAPKGILVINLAADAMLTVGDP